MKPSTMLYLALVGLAGDRPTLLRVADIPTSGEKAKRRVDVAALLRFLQDRPIDHAVIERAQAGPAFLQVDGELIGKANVFAVNAANIRPKLIDEIMN